MSAFARKPRGVHLVGSVPLPNAEHVFRATSTILGQHDVNIASMQVGRDAPRGNAMMILAVDDRVAPDVLAKLREVGGMADLRYVELGGSESDR